ncbi:hypothetical protein [Paraburkholderia sp.]|uniref:hypothetical protein n=1 Tax=Paraburkholderia sp. TaxID=1926495 RepID=UPI003D6E8E4B
MAARISRHPSSVRTRFTDAERRIGQQDTVVLHLARPDARRHSSVARSGIDFPLSNSMSDHARRRDVIARGPIPRTESAAEPPRLTRAPFDTPLDDDRQFRWRQRTGGMAWVALYASVFACGCLLLYVLYESISPRHSGPPAMRTSMVGPAVKTLRAAGYGEPASSLEACVDATAEMRSRSVTPDDV